MKAAIVVAAVLALGAWTRAGAQDAAPKSAVARDRLPVLGTVGDLPPADSCLVAGIQPRGWVTVEGRATDFAGFVKALRARAAAGRPDKGPSPLHLVLRVDRDLPWQAVRWVLAECAAPEARVRRVLFAAVPEDGGAEGAFAFFQPEGPLPRAKSWRFEIRHRNVREPLCPGDVFASMDTLSSLFDSAEYYPSVELAAAPRVTTGDVLRTADMILRRGTRDLRLEGAAAETVPDLEQALKALPPAEGSYSPWEGGSPLRPFSERARRPPPVARVKGALAGILAQAPAAPKAAPAPPPEPPVAIAGAEGLLPRLGTVGDLPPREERIVIDVDAKGGVTVDGKPAPTAVLEGVLVRAARRLSDKDDPAASRLHVVLRLDRRLPWAVAHRLQRMCRRVSPRIVRVLFGAVPEDGGPEGAVAAFEPRFARPGEEGEEIPDGHVLDLRIGEIPKAPEGLVPHDVLSHLREKRGPSPTGGPYLVQVHPSPDTRLGTVLEVYDMVLRWGIRAVTFTCDFDDDGEDMPRLASMYPATKAPLLVIMGDEVVEPYTWDRDRDAPRPRIQGWLAGASDDGLVVRLAPPRKRDDDEEER